MSYLKQLTNEMICRLIDREQSVILTNDKGYLILAYDLLSEIKISGARDFLAHVTTKLNDVGEKNEGKEVVHQQNGELPELQLTPQLAKDFARFFFV